MNYSAIILSGGRGNRMQEAVPKQYLLLGGKPMIIHSIERMDKIETISEIIIVCEESFIEPLKEMIHEYSILKPVIFIEGGQTRQQSVYNGLKAAKEDSIILHEAARPFVRRSDFEALISNPNANVTLGYDIPFTVLTGTSKVQGILNRSELINVQLPQKFNKRALLDAHEKAIKENLTYTEDASLLFDISQEEISIQKGTSINIKITEPLDLELGEIIYKNHIINRK
ncbi:MAG: 2-C-methyl-D-erythritol 4-phosphate cytidylyltransferase [Muribaculaceae bacterium]|nr:2-C-methyl-D-erythritol 4-phosphate cytidylyltransferase [Muribaculaceae bacterium]